MADTRGPETGPKGRVGVGTGSLARGSRARDPIVIGLVMFPERRKPRGIVDQRMRLSHVVEDSLKRVGVGGGMVGGWRPEGAGVGRGRGRLGPEGR